MARDKNKKKEYERKYYIEHREQLLQYSKKYDLTTKKKEYKKKQYLIHKQDENWYRKHKERGKESTKKYRIKNKEKIQDYLKSERWKKVCKAFNERRKQRYHKLGISKRYRGEHWATKTGKSYTKEYRKLKRHKRRILMKNGGELTFQVLQMVYEDNIKKYGTLTCYLCLQPILFGKDHLEHKTPLSRGGTNEYCNLAIACQHCNLTKKTKTEEEYRKENFLWQITPHRLLLPQF